MAQNTVPTFPGKPGMQWVGTGTAANSAKDGTGTVATLLTAPSGGCVIRSVVGKSKGTAAASCLRCFVNNGLTNATAANNSLVSEATLPAIANSETAAQQPVVIDLAGKMIPEGYKLNLTIGSAVAAEWQFTVEFQSLDANLT